MSEETAVNLPGGFVDGDRRVATALLRPLTGREEEWLAGAQGVPNARRVTQVLSSCVIALDSQPVTSDAVRRLLVGDRDFLILQLRRLTLGDQVSAVVTCPACNGSLDMDFRLSEVPVEPRPQISQDYTVVAERSGRPGRAIRFRLPTGADQEAVLGTDLPAAETKLLDACVLDDGGQSLTDEERAMVMAEMEKVAPQVDLELELVCPECGHQFISPCDLTALFFDEMRIQGRQLLREVHSLAFYYHWSEQDILRMTRGRRRAYLGLLREAMSQD